MSEPENAVREDIEKKDLSQEVPQEDNIEDVQSMRATPRRTPLQTTILCVVVIFGVAVAWVSSTQFSKSALVIDPEHFFAPYFLMWCGTTWMILCYPVFIIYILALGASHGDVRERLSLAHRRSMECFGGSWKKGALRVLTFLIFWSGANYSYLRSLGYVSPSVATSISACNTAIVYLLSILLLKDRFVAIKLFSVVFAVTGVVLISLDGKMSGEFLGIFLALLSASCAALYKVMFKRILKDASLGEVSAFMTAIGIFNFFLNAIIAFGLVLLKAEKLEFAYIPWAPMLASGVLNLLFNFLINFGIALLHPLVISVGMLVGIPLNATVDIIFRGVDPTVYFISGTATIVLSFFLVVFPYELVQERLARNNNRCLCC